MRFVNEIGEIVHGVVDRYSGAANKNIGDAFLLVWFIPNNYYKYYKHFLVLYNNNPLLCII